MKGGRHYWCRCSGKVGGGECISDDVVGVNGGGGGECGYCTSLSLGVLYQDYVFAA